MKPLQFIIVIHANSEWNEQGLWQGQCDTRLSETGMKMADCLAARKDLYDIQAIYSSDLRRAKDTVRPLAARLGLTVNLDCGLREGRWPDYTQDEHIPLLPADYGFESRDDLARRAVGTLNRLADSCQVSPVLVVTHGTFLECFIRHMFPAAGDGPAIRTALNRFTCRSGRWSLESLNDHSHLPQVEPGMICVTTRQPEIRCRSTHRLRNRSV